MSVSLSKENISNKLEKKAFGNVDFEQILFGAVVLVLVVFFTAAFTSCMISSVNADKIAIASNFDNVTDFGFGSQFDARQTGTAANGSLRQLEQISRGVEFNYSFNIRVTDEDDAEKLKAFLIEGMTKLEDFGIGSGNSRGVGRIKFLTREIEEIDY